MCREHLAPIICNFEDLNWRGPTGERGRHKKPDLQGRHRVAFETAREDFCGRRRYRSGPEIPGPGSRFRRLEELLC